ncbi:CNH domain-containing protein [Sphaerosporella brunnea]|uniref:CNH domain-containing protein n=1 Tax=Sphaerosporella brunnea TaxID=1250544 RepID=A0A5J5ERK9_9PEZI|nr:CNH domain-containing protein [Sphaerosporella brunnea]
MADPYQQRAHSSYSRTTRSQHQQHQPSSNLTRTLSFDNGDDASYFDGGTGVSRRLSVQTTLNEEYYDDRYATQQPHQYQYQQQPPPPPPPPPPNRRGSVATMADRDSSPGGTYFAVTPGGNGYGPPYSPGFAPPHDGVSPNAPYPTSPGNPSAPSNQPYNPAAYHPQRHATTAGNTYGPQRHASTAGSFSPTTASYDPNLYTAPYPTSSSFRGSGPAQSPLQMPGTGSVRYGGYQYSNRSPYPSTQSYMSPTVPYSPGLPPLPSQSAPPQNGYQPPPPPPPPHPPGSPAFTTPYPSHSPSQSSLSYNSYLGRPETHYHSGSESDVSPPNEPEAPHHPLPSPPQLPFHNSHDLPSPPPPEPPVHGQSISRHGSQSRPLPQLPNGDDDGDLYGEIEASLSDMGTSGLSDYDRDSVYGHRRNGTNGTIVNPRIDSVYDYYSNESDAEALAGLAMMRHDEEMEVEAQRRGSHAPLPPTPREDDSDLDYAPAGVDIGMIGGGGYGGFFGYGTEDDTPPPPPVQRDTGLGIERSASDASGESYFLPDESDLHPFPQFRTNVARVDTFGTGGFAPPSQASKRMSFDEGDEEFERAHTDSPAKRSDSDDDFPELFYHPPPSSSPRVSRPLPSPPGYEYGVEPQTPARSSAPQIPPYGINYQQQMYDSQAQSTRFPSTPASPCVYSNMNLGSQLPYIPRTISLNSHTSTPSAQPPVRSKTDGKIHPKSNRASMIAVGTGLGLPDSELSPGLTPSDLPAIPLTRKFDPKKLSTKDFRKCTAPWALSGISAWLKEMTEGEQDLKEALVADAVAALFTHYVPTMNVADAETLAAKVVSGMLEEKNLIKEEEWVKFGPGEVCGVIYQITGNGCYASRLHELDSPGRCYAHHCARTLRKITLPAGIGEVKQMKEDWATYWKIKKEDTADVNKKEIERQNNLHEIVQTEEEFLEHMKVLKSVYRDQIANANPSIIKPNRLDNFVRDVFGKADAVRKVSEEHLLPQLKFRQREQGPWIVGFSDIFREWIRKAKTAYLDYAAAFPKADMLVRREADRNMLFRTFLETCRQDPRARRLDWVTFLKGPITRLQRYSLLLATVLKHTITETEEKHNLERAIEEIKAVTHDCDARVDEMSKRIQLLELGLKLMMRQWPVDLRLEEKGRELIFKGDLQRTGSNRFTWLETHCILFDHYLVLAKTQMQKEIAGGQKHERYDVSRMPIPMDLLVLESTNDDPVVRSAANKLGIAGPTAVAVTNRGRHNSASTVPQLQHTNTSTSVNSTATAPGRLVTNLQVQNDRDDKILYPFRIKHLGNPARVLKTDDNTYILYAPSAANRQDWCDKIILAKEKHAASLHAQNAEPFRLNVLADAAFAYDSATAQQPKPIRIRGTPLDRAIAEVEKRYEATPKPTPVCKAMVNCATAFTARYGREVMAIGTDYGVYIADANNPRGWSRAISAVKVTQIAVLEEFSLFLVLADKALIAYHLDVVVPPPGDAANTATKQKAPQKLSGAKDVGFFATGRMKDRTLVFYKKREGLSSTFKVLEPVFQKATEKKSRFSRKGTTEFFREFDEFYIPTDCYGINLFHSSLAVHTSKGFEVMTLDKKQAWSVPELRAGTHVDDIASRLSGEKPLGMFRLSDIEFLLCYEECAVYVNKHGDVSRSVVMEFVGKAITVAMYGPYVLVFDQDFLEIRNAQNGRLRQVIAGRDMRCLDDAMHGSSPGGRGRTVKVAMAHPEVDGRQLVVELVLNEGQTD